MRRRLKFSVLILTGSINCALFAQLGGGKHYDNSNSLSDLRETAKGQEITLQGLTTEESNKVLYPSKHGYTMKHAMNDASEQAKGQKPMPGTASSCAAGFTTTNSCGNYTLINTGSAAPAVQSFSFVGVNAPASFTTTSSSSTVSFATGTYTIIQTVTDSACADTESLVILVPPPPDAAFSTSNFTQCLDGNSFTFTASTTAGIHSYSFNPSAGAPAPGTTANYGPVSFSSAGTFTVTHNVDLGCTASTTSVITIHPNPSAILTQTNATCGLSNAVITISNTSSGSQTVTSYALNSATLSGQTITGLGAGAYTISITNNFGCPVQYTLGISDTPSITALATTSTDPGCGNNNGSINIGLVSGGTPGYSFNVNGGAYSTSTSLTALAPGTYSIGVIDNVGCVFTKVITLNNIPGPTSTTITVTNPKCGNANGSATVTSVSGGAPPFQYAFNGGAFTGADNINGLSPGTYSVVVKDANNCTVTANFNLVDPGNPTLNVGNLTNVSCFGNANGNITLNASGGSAGFSYTLNPGSLVNSTGIFSGLSAGNYVASVSDAVGCIASISVAITQPTPLALNFTTTPNTCAGSVGSVTMGVSGGMPAYSYSINGSGSSNITTGLATGMHTAFIKDANGCTISGNFNMTILPGPNSGTVQVTNSTCGNANGTATVTAVAGGVSPYQYAFNGGSFSGASNIGGLSSGTHAVIIRDANTCTTSVNFSIVDPGNPIPVLNNTKNVSCFGLADGSFTLTANGGFPGYTYTLNPGPVSNSTGIFSGLNAQNYVVTVKDAIGCSATISVNITQPAALTLTLMPTNITCNGAGNGIIAMSSSGGTMPYMYSMNGAPFVSATSYSNLGVGSYSVTVRDNNNCTLNQVTSITQPAPLAISFTTIPNSCAGTVGSVTIGVTGGTPAYSYSINGNPTSYTATNLASGNHGASVKDANGCTIAGTFSIGLITGPTSANLAISNAPCGNNNSSATVTAVSGGTPAYVYSFNGGPFSSTNNVGNLAAGGHNVVIKDINTCTVQVFFIVSNTTSQQFAITGVANVDCFGGSNGSFTATSNSNGTYTVLPGGYTNTTGIFNNLTAGAYTVMIQHAAGCVATVTVTVPQPPTPVTLTLNSSGSVNCYGGGNGNIVATGAGGVGPYQYSINGGAFQASASFTNLTAGVYNVTVRDNNGCTATKSMTITQPPPLNLITATLNSTCTAANGSALVNVSGGTPAYSYTWTGGGGYAFQANNLVAGSYTVTVGDANGCKQTAVAVVNASPGGAAVITASTNVSCNGMNNGSMTAGTTGPMTAPLSYSWNNGQNTQTATNLFAGNYTVTVTDVNGCKSSVNGTISEPGILMASISSSSVSCFGGNNGTASISYMMGGTPPLNYLWSPGGATTSALSNLFQGVYTCTVTDSKGCTIVQTATVSQPASLTIATSSITAAKCGQTNGSATVTANGGIAPYSFNWSGGTSGPVLSNAGAGSYTVTVNDVNNCSYSTAINITNATSPIAGISSQVNVNCNGGNNGAATATVSGASPPYSYLWSNGQASATAQNLMAGVYSASVTDNNGCIAITTVTITQPPAITLTTSSINSNCTAANGIASVTVSGGSPAYTYNWSGGGGSLPQSNGLPAGTYSVTVTDSKGCVKTSMATINSTPGGTAVISASTSASCFGYNNGSMTAGFTGNMTAPLSYSWNNGQNTQTATNLAAGFYTVTVTDVYGCVSKISGNISQPAALNFNMSSSNVSCFGGANGSATANYLGGGTAPVNYLWSAGGASSVIVNLPQGVYTCTLSDANGCSAIQSATVTQPTSITINSSITAAKCNQSNGSATVTANGGSPAYTYSWSNGSTSSVLSGVGAGSFTVGITDANNCLFSSIVSVTSAATPVISVTSQTNVNCFGGNNGAATTFVSGGASPYSYLWSNGQNSSNLANVLAGVYTATVTDQLGCMAVTSVTITQPPLLNLSTSSINSNCTAANGIASVTVTGGSPGYTYAWTGGGGSAAQTSGLVAGTYSVTVIDSKGCTKTAVTIINANPGGAAIITASANVTCFGYNNGSISAGVSGSMSAPLTYSWSNGQNTQTATNLTAGSYSVLVTDTYGCTGIASANISQPAALNFNLSSTNVNCYGGANGSATANYLGGGTPPINYLWSAGGATSVIANLPQGVYSCTLTDANACSAVQSVTITQPSSVTLTSTVTTANCNKADGSATVSVSGGIPAYSYTWSNGTTGPILSNAIAGTYTITVKDANNCLYTTAATIPNTAGPVMGLLSQTNVSCNGANNGVATVTVSGGAAPYVYQWSNGQNTGTATNLMAGIHTATITDQNGCKASISVLITQPPLLYVSISANSPRCYNAMDGTANAGVLGGTGPYTYTWTPTGGNNASAAAMGAGNYFVTVTDANGCVATASTNLSNPPQMLASVSATNVSCFNACNGQAVGSATNTIGAVTWYWTGGPSPIATQSVSGLCAGTYTMVATDQNNCTATSIVTITQPSVLAASISASANVGCAGNNNGYATVTSSGGTPGYSYSWTSSSSTLATASNLSAGVYSVTVTDSKGCSIVTGLTITQPSSLQATASGTNVTCSGLNNGIGNVTYNGGTAPYSILWSPSLGNTATVYNLTPGTHTVAVTDNNGCKNTNTISITEPPAINAIVTTTNSNCTQANGNACVNASGGAGGFSYQWNANPSYTLSCMNNVSSGVYTVVVTDANNCQVTALAVVNDISGPNVAITTSSAVTCYGGNNGIAVAAVSGGTGTLSILWSYQAQTTTSVSNLPAGTHVITVQDSATCITSATVQISQPTQINTAITNVNQVTCNGINDGQATILVNGGTPAYTYSWIPTSQTSSVGVSLSAGTHTCMVTDANGCVVSNSVVIVQPSPLLVNSFTLTNLTCNGNNTGQIATTITGGSPSYILNWTPTQPQNAMITNLAAGSYSLSVTDNKGCKTYATYFITEPTALVASAAATPAKCGNSNGSATVTVSGGTPTYTYNWNTPIPQNTSVISGLSGNTWNCNITDANGCIITQSIQVADAPGPQITASSFTSPSCFGQNNGAMGITFTQGSAPFSVLWSDPAASTSQTVNGVSSGMYTAVITDFYGCTTSTVVNVTQPNPLVLAMVPTQTICFGQSIQVYATAGGGTQPYSYSWNNPALIGGGPHTVSLTAGVGYSVSATDANGCPAVVNSSYIFVNPPLVTSGNFSRHCDGTQVTLTPQFTSPGNGGPYTYLWSDGSFGPSMNLTASAQNTNNSYWVIVKDGCTSPNAVATFSVKVDDLPTVMFTADNTKGCQPLSVLLTAVSSCSNPTYVWNTNNDLYNGNPIHVVYTEAGTYSVGITVTSPEGCSTSANAMNYIEVYPNPIADFVADPSTTSELSPGIQFNNMSQGAVFYSWNFDDPSSVNNVSGATNPEHIYEAAGEHTVVLIATSNKGCKDTAVKIIQVTHEFALFIPNAFTPNNDGKNDVFLPLGVGFDESRFLMIIFDRWGEQIFKTEDPHEGWNGSVKGNNIVAEQGVYVYKIMVGDKLGEDHKFVGHVTCLPKEAKFSGR